MALSWVITTMCFIGIVHSGTYESFMLTEHNRYRKMEVAANMQKMVWSTTLENAALAWAKTCTQGHQNAGYGENLYMYTKNNYPEKDLIAKGIKAWYDEKSLWTWGSGFSSATGHYTQLVWANTNQVGCATYICNAQGMFVSSYLYLACFYSPAGNVGSENPYIRGTACSKCTSGQQCDNGLCSGSQSGGGNTGSTWDNTNDNANTWDNNWDNGGSTWDDGGDTWDNSWDNGGNTWDNGGSTWDDRGNTWDNSWDNGGNTWDNGGNTWDDGGNTWDNSWDNGGNTWDNGGKRWDDGGNTWDNNWDNDGSTWDNSWDNSGNTWDNGWYDDGNTWDGGGNTWDNGGNTWDNSGSTWDDGGNTWDNGWYNGGNAWDNGNWFKRGKVIRRRPHTTRSPLYKRQIVLQRILSHAPSIKHHRIKQIQLGKPLETRYQLSNVQHGNSVEAKYHLRHAHLGKPTEKIQQERNVPISREKQDKVKLPGRKSTTNKHLTVQLLVRMLNALKQKPVEFTETEQMANDR